MKNKTLKNLIIFGIFAVSIFSVNTTSASAFVYYDSPIYSGYNTVYTGSSFRNSYADKQNLLQQQYNYEQNQLQLSNQIAQQKYYNEQQSIIREQNLALQKQALASNVSSTSTIYTQPTTQYIAQPTTTQIKYIPQQTVTTSSQGASAFNSVYSTNTSKNNTGGYVNYDSNLQAASAYGYNNGQVVSQNYDPNGVTALSLNGSGGFLPTSIFGWFILILLILAIIIFARIIIRKSHSSDPHAVPAH